MITTLLFALQVCAHHLAVTLLHVAQQRDGGAAVEEAQGFAWVRGR